MTPPDGISCESYLTLRDPRRRTAFNCFLLACLAGSAFFTFLFLGWANGL
jgi:hypothetical protein